MSNLDFETDLWNKNYNFIKVKFYEDKIKSNKTINLINY